MSDQRTMVELLHAPTEGYEEAIVVPPILDKQFELKHSLINMMTSDQFFGLEKDNPHDHIHWFNKITPTIKYNDVPNLEIKLMLFPSLSQEQPVLGSKKNHATTNLRNEISNFQQRFDESFHETWDRYKDLLRACPRHGFTKFYQLDTFYNALNPVNQDSLNFTVGGNLLERRTQDVLTIIENKSKVLNSRNKSIVSQVKSSDGNSSSSSSSEIAKLTHVLFPNEPASTLGSRPLPSNTIANPKGELKAITNQSGLVLDGPSVPMPPPFINPKEDEHVDETLTEPELGDFTIKVPPPLQDKDEIQIHKFWQMFKQLHINITLVDALVLILKYQKMLKALLSNKEKLLELANTPLNENYLAVILKKLPEKLGDPGEFLIMCGFSELKCKALANLGASINLMPVLIWKKLGLPELISTRMTFELANRAICTPARIARDVFVPVGKFTFPVDFIIFDYESDPQVPLILGRPFLWTAQALINVHGEEMILCDGDERLTLNMRHDTSSYSNQPQKESINMINIYNDSCDDYLEDLFATNHLSGNPTFLLYRFNFTGSYQSIKEIEYFLNHDPTKEMDSILKDSVDEDNFANPIDNIFDTIPEMFTDEHTLDYSSPPLYDEFDDDLLELESDNDDYDAFLFEDFSEVDALPLTNNEDKVFNQGILIQENISEVTIQVTPDKNVKKIFISNSSLILNDFDPPLYDLPFHKEVLGSETLLLFSFENEEKVFKLGILTSKGVHTSLLLELSHQGPKVFKVFKILESPMEIFPYSYGEDIRILNVLCLHFYPP
nr:hypothetical protein [Tanacetum cinerariifolium]